MRRVRGCPASRERPTTEAIVCEIPGEKGESGGMGGGMPQGGGMY